MAPAAAPPPAETAPPDVVAEITPSEIVVVNDTAEALTFDRSFGPGAMIHIGSAGHRPLPTGTTIDDVDDAHTGGWIKTCLCDCAAGGECPECEPPRLHQITLQPGESYTVPWNGMLRARLVGGSCLTRFPVMAWPYVLTACTASGRCGRAEVTFPSSDPVTIKMSASAAASTCADLSANALRRAGSGVWTAVGRALPDRPVSDCAPDPTCTESDALDATLAAARAQSCTNLVVPRGDHIEAIIFLPLPEDTRGGERYSHFYDPDATHLYRARYEQ